MPAGKNRRTGEIVTAAGEMDTACYILRLFVAGMTPRSAEAIRRVTGFCEKHLAGHHSLEIIDIYQNPELLRDEQIIAVPTLVKRLPKPLRLFVGDMTNEEKLFSGLDLAAGKP